MIHVYFIMIAAVLSAICTPFVMRRRRRSEIMRAMQEQNAVTRLMAGVPVVPVPAVKDCPKCGMNHQPGWIYCGYYASGRFTENP